MSGLASIARPPGVHAEVGEHAVEYLHDKENPARRCRRSACRLASQCCTNVPSEFRRSVHIPRIRSVQRSVERQYETPDRLPAVKRVASESCSRLDRDRREFLEEHLRIAAVGTASMAPRMPNSDPPMSSATMTVTGLTPTRRLHDLRHEDVRLRTGGAIEEVDADAQREPRRHGERHGDRGHAAEDRPDDRESSRPSAAMSATHVEVRHAHQAEARRPRTCPSRPPESAARPATR